MAKSMRSFDGDLVKEGKALIGLAKAGEMVRAIAGPGTPAFNQWPVHRLEALYELAYLRMFVAWETFLEETFYRYMCGQVSRFGQAVPVAQHYRSVAAAEAAFLGNRYYRAWYDVTTVITVCQKHIVNGTHEIAFRTNSTWLDPLSRIRHRIAHGQKDAKRKFDSATLALSGRVYLASRPGRFLRDWDTTTVPQVRWLEKLIGQIGTLAGQII
ncbi:MAG: hypothetical protein EXS05_11510 [Planctomycetaceae bacterium]|nr:hypothetical protein [Planctomycetaceae bacterium]